MSDGYITADELKSSINLLGQSYADPDIQAAITAASRGLDRLCKRRGTGSRLGFEQDADANQTRYYTPVRQGHLAIDDLVTFTSLATDPSGDGTFSDAWTVDVDFTLEPINAATEERPYTRIVVRPSGTFFFWPSIPKSVKLVGQFGWPDVPPEIIEATTIVASKLVKRKREAPFGVIAVNMDGAAIRIAKSDPDVMFLVADYIKHRVSAA